jgi:hypothetical protein
MIRVNHVTEETFAVFWSNGRAFRVAAEFGLRMPCFISVILHANMDICFTRFNFGFSVSCFLSFIHFLSGYTRDMIGLTFPGVAI